MLKQAKTLIASSIRYKLLVLVLFPLLVVMVAVITMAYFWANEVSFRQLLMKVNSDLAVTQQAFESRQNDYLSDLELLAKSYSFQQALHQNQQHLLHSLLSQQYEQFDFITLLDRDGCDIWNKAVCHYSSSSLFKHALQEQALSGIEVHPKTLLSSWSEQHLAKLQLPIIDTPRAKPSEQIFESRAMISYSYQPVFDENKQVKYVLMGAVLLNQNFEFVDNLRDLVYGQGSLDKDGLGTVTIFLDDIRISTNVPQQLAVPEQRAVGTRVSEEVREQVLTQGERWVDRAFVVSDWFISAYEPILDSDGKRVGMLYTGFLEAPYRATFFSGLQFLLFLFAMILLVSILMAVYWAKSIYNPIKSIINVVNKVEGGVESRIGELDVTDEIATLAQHFDHMLDVLQAQHHQIQLSARDLENKVELRTQELSQQKRDLQQNIELLNQTREKLVAKEKLAAVGQLAAGVAHEINNPTAVILGNMDLLIDDLGEHAKPISTQTDLIIQQVYRIRAIINNLLQYSRPESYQEVWNDVDMNRVISDSLVLVQHDLIKHHVSYRQDCRATRKVTGNHQQYQQVIINLLINAVNAIGDKAKGSIRIRSRNWKDNAVLVTIRDNGCGISEENLKRIFDPFFTKTTGGTGLGLHVTNSILDRYGAEISVRSKLGSGTCFYLWFQCKTD